MGFPAQTSHAPQPALAVDWTAFRAVSLRLTAVKYCAFYQWAQHFEEFFICLPAVTPTLTAMKAALLLSQLKKGKTSRDEVTFLKATQPGAGETRFTPSTLNLDVLCFAVPSESMMSPKASFSKAVKTLWGEIDKILVPIGTLE